MNTLRKILHATILLWLLLFQVAVGTASVGKCFLEMSRDLRSSTSQDQYTLLCKCDPLTVKGIARAIAPSPKNDTVGHNNAAVRCVEEQSRNLTRMCNRLNGTEFDRQASPVFRQCLQNPSLTEEEQKQTEPFTFEKATCSALFVWLEDCSRVGWLCQCPQFGFYEVKPGLALYEIGGNETERATEFEAFTNCAEEDKDQLQQVCTNSPSDFNILAVQLFQTCCKQSRVNSDSKFECEAVVPDAVQLLKIDI